MPERKPNQLARIVAVVGLIAAFMAVAATVFTSESSDSGDGDKSEKERGDATKAGERALERGFWKVQEGDTLDSIAAKTGIDVSELEALNPGIDPQALTPGERVFLLDSARPGAGGGGSGGFGDEGASTEGSGVGDEGPTGQATETDGFAD
jgi:LysM repeat protein